MSRVPFSLLAMLVLSGCVWTSDSARDSSSSISSSASSITTSSTSSPGVLSDLITVQSPAPDAIIASPLTVTGQARGNWYFEASFPVRLLDGNDVPIASAVAQAQGDWMTTNFVPFSAVLNYVGPVTQTGTLVLQKDNPSGDPQFDQELRIPVRFW